jgi:uncharacterized protein YcbK (DUF882 family)
VTSSWLGRNRTAPDRRSRTRLGAAALAGAAACLQAAGAQGETRSLSFFHTHTSESATITFRRDGSYDQEGLRQLNWLLRDWRVEEPAAMDPRLFDIVWEVYRESGSQVPIQVISAYRSPKTNAMLRNRSRAVSEHSQHMQGRAIDIRLPDVSTERLRTIAMRLQYGGVGYYSSSAFVHVDTGSVRAWPRMSEEQLARLFPDGKTVHLPPSGKPLARYAEARAELDARDRSLGSATGAGGSFGGLFAALFGKNSAQPAPAAAIVASAEAEPARGTAPADALAFAPLPPRRPAEPPLSPEAPIQVAAATPAASVEPAALAAVPAPEHRTEASRLLFSPVPVDAAASSAASAAAGGRTAPVELLAAAGLSSLDIRFSQRAGGPGLAFSSPPRPLPVMAGAEAAL